MDIQTWFLADFSFSVPDQLLNISRTGHQCPLLHVSLKVLWHSPFNEF